MSEHMLHFIPIIVCFINYKCAKAKTDTYKSPEKLRYMCSIKLYSLSWPWKHISAIANLSSELSHYLKNYCKHHYQTTLIWRSEITLCLFQHVYLWNII